MHTLLIFGGSSLLALNWALGLKNDLNIILVCHKTIVKPPGLEVVVINFDSEPAILDIILHFQPDWILNCVGMTNVDACEQDYKLAFHVNCKIPSLLAKCCRISDTPFIHVSTDQIFSGYSQFYSESSKALPLNNYGKTKLLAESKVARLNPESLILRTNFYGWGPKYRLSYSDYILSALRNGRSVKLFSDLFYTPVLASVVVDTAMKLIRSSHYGLFNIASDERVSKLEFGNLLATEFALDSTLIVPALASSTARLARRPLDMSLSNSKVKNVVKLPIMSMKDQISTLRRQEAAFTQAFMHL